MADGVTPLWWLPDDEEKAMALVELLIAAGAHPAAKHAEGRTAADWARRRGMLSIARRLESNTISERTSSRPARESREESSSD